MFRKMRRKEKLLAKEESIKILNKCTSGVLGTIDKNGYPYTVPMSYAYEKGKIYLHSAQKGHKIESIKNNDKVTFCVIERDDIVQKEFTTHFRSVCLFGRAVFITDDLQKRKALDLLVEKYFPDYSVEAEEVIRKGWAKVCLIEISIDHMTGKAAPESSL